MLRVPTALILLPLAACFEPPPPPVAPTTTTTTGATPSPTGDCAQRITDFEQSDGVTVSTDWHDTEIRDAAGLLLQRTIEDQLTPEFGFGWNFAYDATGRMIEMAFLDWQGVTTEVDTYTHTYDAAGLLVSTQFSSTEGVAWVQTFAYDANGRLLEVDADGLQEDGIDGVIDQIVRWSYDPGGWASLEEGTAPAYPGWGWNREYDARGLNTSMSDWEDFAMTAETTWTWDALGNVDSEVRDYDADGEAEMIFLHSWTYDAEDRPLVWTTEDNGDGIIDDEQVFGYDANGELSWMTRDNTYPGAIDSTWAYTYSVVACP